MNERRWGGCGLLALILVAAWAPLAMAAEETATIEALVSRFEEEQRFSGSVLVARGDEVLFEGGVGEAERSWHVPNRADTVFLVGSISKQFTATLILQLVARGKIDLNATIDRYLPDFPADKAKRITVHQLLCHTSGLPHYGGFREIDVDLDDYLRLYRPVADYVDLIGKLELQSEPGTKHSYSSMGYIVLGYLAETVSGKSFGRLLEERIARPLGLRDLGFRYDDRIVERLARGYRYELRPRGDGTIDVGYVPEPYRDQSNKYCTGGVHASVRSMFTWARALFTDGLLPEKYRNMMFSPQAENYGYGWRIDPGDSIGLDESVEVISHGGALSGYRANILILDRGRYTIIALGNSDVSRADAVTEGIARLLHGKDPGPANILGTAVAWRIAAQGVEAGRAFFHQQKAAEFRDYINNDYAFLAYADQFVAVDQPKLALALVELGLQAHPRSPMMHLGLAVARDGLGDAAAARAAARKALALLEEAEETPGFVEERIRELL